MGDRTLTHRPAMLPFLAEYTDNETGAKSGGWAVPSMVQDPMDAFARVFGGNGLPDPQDPQTQADVGMILSTIYGGNTINPAAKVPAGAVGMFAGRMAKTADHAALAKAEKMAAEGADRNAIWNETGWFQGPDQKWRFEIDDSTSGFIPPGSTYGEMHDNAGGFKSMGDLLSHEKLFDAYPGTRDLGLGVSKGDTYGSFGGRGPNEIEIKGSSPPREALETVLHESQHSIQAREGFARGGNQESMAPPMNSRKAWEARLPAAVRSELDDRGIKTMYEWDDGWPAIKEALRQRIEDDIGEPFKFRTIPGMDGMDEAAFALEQARIYPADTLNAISLNALRNLGYRDYERLAGEVEARNVQTRMNMSAAERRASPPWNTQDIPDEMQIVRGGIDTATLKEIIRKRLLSGSDA